MQRVNFFSILPKAVPPTFPAYRVRQLLLLAAVLLLLVTVVESSRFYYEKSSYKRLLTEKKSVLKVFQQTANAHPMMAKQAPLEEQIKTLQEELDAKQQALNQLTKSKKLQGFSEYMLELAEKVPTGLWFSNIVFGPEDGKVVLKGQALSAKQVPMMMTQLRESSWYTKDNFKLFAVQQDEKKPLVNFVLGNVEQEAKTVDKPVSKANSLQPVKNKDDDAKSDTVRQTIK